MPQYQVQDVRVETVTKGRNSYQAATVVYDNKGQNKEKKVLSFSNPMVFSIVKELKQGTWIEVEFAKDDPYFNWAKVTPVGGATEAPTNAPGASTSDVKAPVGGKVLGNQYETRDERNMRQLHIVRQSSLSNAVNALSPGAKAPLKVEDVLALAQEFVDFVYTQEDLAPPDTVNEEISY